MEPLTAKQASQRPALQEGHVNIRHRPEYGTPNWHLSFIYDSMNSSCLP